jgi:hypothetical protein
VFVVGVTGHRNLRAGDVAALEKAVGAVFDELSARPWKLLSALAEGADQLVARVALARGVPVTAVLPMPEAVYRSTLDEAARGSFDELLGRAAEVVVLPPRDVRETRVDRYEALAAYLARECQAVVALWDGQPGERFGTADVVARMAAKGRRVWRVERKRI